MTNMQKRLAKMREDYALDRAPMAPNTERNYRSALKLFRDWLSAEGVQWAEWTHEHLMLYLGETAPGRDPMTRWMVINALRRVHPERDDATRHPDVMKLRKGLRQRKRTVGTRRAYPLTPAEVDALIEAGWKDRHRYESLHQWRKRAMRFEASVLLAYYGLLRVSELAAIEWRDLEERRDGSGYLTIRQSKTDQAGVGQRRPYPAPIMQRIIRLRSYLLGGQWSPDGTEVGYVPMPKWSPLAGRKVAYKAESFRKGLDRVAYKAGMGELGITTHSFRRGAATAMAERGISDRIIAKEGRWSSPAMLDIYADELRPGSSGMARIAEEHENGGGE